MLNRISLICILQADTKCIELADFAVRTNIPNTNLGECRYCLLLAHSLCLDIYVGCISAGLTLVPAAIFWRRLPAAGGYFTPWHISSSRAHSNKIPTAIRMFSGSNFLLVQLPVSRDVDVRQKSKMAVAKMKCTYFTAVCLIKDNL